MATEPAETSISYTPCAAYTPPVGRLAILGKARAEIDKLRTTIADDLNQMDVRTAAQIDSNYKICQEMAALRVQTADGTYKIYAEVDALIARTANENAKTAAEVDSLNKKTEAEVDLLDQKAVTELAQTSNYIPLGSGMNTATSVDGVIDKQKLLFAKQTDGFDRDAEQKLAKIYVDTWSVRATTDTADVLEAGLADAEIAAVLTKAKTGISA